ncbi:isoprenylcysteine carboxylmethyltransferase family protein [Methanocella sp. CWC-04]|uniref:Isoprenylcysteine carboxylmethyltransferase family protein n=2 Tax=Methanooceanicella nereidis TaxID=2052831 RepID=A0AAP2RDY5_9EURY|nr:isoprenylcysteine carboxylmethyltransferase family protein [Methanocella sp. CWC-04]
MSTVWDYYGLWWAVAIWVLLYGLFIFFIPFYKKSHIIPSSAYLAFIVAFAVEMYGLPFSMYMISWLFGFILPVGVFWGHTLVLYIGDLGMYAGILLTLIGIFMIVFGWKDVYMHYWSKKKGEGSLVKEGIYAYVRHPQYTGLLLISLGMLVQWATIPLLFMWPVLAILYYRLAKKEELSMEEEFGQDYTDYKNKTYMFLPYRLRK